MKELPEHLRGEVADVARRLQQFREAHTPAGEERPDHGLDKVTQGANLDKNTAHDMKHAEYERSRVSETIEVSQPKQAPPVKPGSRIDKALEQARKTGHDAPSPSNTPYVDR